VVKYFSALVLTRLTMSAVCSRYELCFYNDTQCCGSVMNDGVAHVTLDYSALG
jgi:hypothetical protein